MDETMPGDLVIGEGKTIDDWEKGIQETKQKARRRTIVKKRFKV